MEGGNVCAEMYPVYNLLSYFLWEELIYVILDWEPKLYFWKAILYSVLGSSPAPPGPVRAARLASHLTREVQYTMATTNDPEQETFQAKSCIANTACSTG